MKAAIMVGVVVLLAGTTRAENVKPPAGWKQDPERATSLAAKANEVSHFGGLRSLATADVFVAPEGAAALIVTTVAGKVTPADRDAAARFAVDEVQEATTRASLSAGGIKVDAWAARVVADQKLVRGDLQWSDNEAGTQTTTVIQVVADDDNIIAITGECVVANPAAPIVAACHNALGTLDPGIPLEKRQPLGLAAPGTGLSAPAPAKPSTLSPSTMSDGSRTPLPPINIATEKPKPTRDLRPVYVGLGIVLLAAVFWWNQRRRARFEKDSDE
jgi:hypothetical protein